jgi:UDP-N-acetylglucosamine 1-carboxyvinyltransferase
VLGLSEAQVLARGRQPAGATAQRLFLALLERRLGGEPVAYLLGEREFYGRSFAVDRRVLVPRPETEHLVEAALAARLPRSPRILDLGTGSGCLAVTLALELPAARLVATDLSPGALAVAAANVRRWGVEGRVGLAAADLFAGLDLAAFDLVVSNPPYIDRREAPTLSPEVVDFEPAAGALRGGARRGGARRDLRRRRRALPRRPGPRRDRARPVAGARAAPAGIAVAVGRRMERLLPDPARDEAGAGAMIAQLPPLDAEPRNRPAPRNRPELRDDTEPRVEKLKIEGPVALRGTVTASGAKNAALPALAATLLTDERVELGRVPDVRDIRTLCRLLDHLGSGCDALGGGRVDVERVGEFTSPHDAPYEVVKTMRAGILVLGPVLARRGTATVSLPGGCAIGNRPIEEHLKGMEKLGANVRLEGGYVTAEAKRLRGAKYRFGVPTVTGTENVMMAATLARGLTVLENCAQEAEIADLAELLNKMGARIAGAGTSTIEIEGVEELHGARHDIIPDRIEAGSYLIGAVMTGGDVTVRGARVADLGMLKEKLEEAGATVEETADGMRAAAGDDLGPSLIETAPHPGFPTDLQAQFMALATQADVFRRCASTSSRTASSTSPSSNRMGADIRVRNRTAKVRGKTKLTGGPRDGHRPARFGQPRARRPGRAQGTTIRSTGSTTSTAATRRWNPSCRRSVRASSGSAPRTSTENGSAGPGGGSPDAESGDAPTLHHGVRAVPRRGPNPLRPTSR